MHFAWAMDLDPRGNQQIARETAEYAQLTDDDIRALEMTGEEQPMTTPVLHGGDDDEEGDEVDVDPALLDDIGADIDDGEEVDGRLF